MTQDPVNWEQLYRDEFMPWDTKKPDSHLVKFVSEKGVPPCRMFEPGCGTGTNAIWLAGQGFTVTATDLSETALKLAGEKEGADLCNFILADFLEAPVPGTDFQFVYDLGCFHGVAGEDVRLLFARKVAECLVDDGLWLSVSGSTDGPEFGPPRISACDIVSAVEPFFEILSLKTTQLDKPEDDDQAALSLPPDFRVRAWVCLMKKRNKKGGQV